MEYFCGMKPASSSVDLYKLVTLAYSRRCRADGIVVFVFTERKQQHTLTPKLHASLTYGALKRVRGPLLVSYLTRRPGSVHGWHLFNMDNTQITPPEHR